MTEITKSSKQKFTKKDLIKLVIFVVMLTAITILTLINLFSDQKSLDDFVTEIKKSELIWIIMLMIAVPTIWIVTDAFVLYKLTSRTYTKYKFRQAVSAVGLYIIFSLLTPFQSGGQVFQIIYMRKQGVKYSTAVSSTIAAAVMFQLITVPVSTGLFAYVVSQGGMYDGFMDIINGLPGIAAEDSPGFAMNATIIALSVNLLLMFVPIIISCSKTALQGLSHAVSYITATTIKEEEKHDIYSKIYIISAISLWIFVIFMVLFEKQVLGTRIVDDLEVNNILFPYYKTILFLTSISIIVIGRIHSMELLRINYVDKVNKTREAMLQYKKTFVGTITDKSILIPCLLVMFIKEVNHSLSIVWAAEMIGEDGLSHWFELAALKNVLTLAQTTIPTPGGSGGAEIFYIVAALNSYPAAADGSHAVATAIGLSTRFATYWALLICAFIVKTWWRPSRIGFGIKERASLKTPKLVPRTVQKKGSSAMKKSHRKQMTETQVLNAKKVIVKKSQLKKQTTKKIIAKKSRPKNKSSED